MLSINEVKRIPPVLVIFALILFGSTAAWSHGDGTSIIPASLTVKSGTELEVKVNGLVGTKTATFRLTGMTGKYELGEFPISGDDFHRPAVTA
jgi:hypothetical protein